MIWLLEIVLIISFILSCTDYVSEKWKVFLWGWKDVTMFFINKNYLIPFPSIYMICSANVVDILTLRCGLSCTKIHSDDSILSSIKVKSRILLMECEYRNVQFLIKQIINNICGDINTSTLLMKGSMSSIFREYNTDLPFI